MECWRHSLCLSTQLCGPEPEPCALHCETPCSLASMLFSQWRPPICRRWEGGGERYQGICTQAPFLKGHHRLQGHAIQHRFCQAALSTQGSLFPRISGIAPSPCTLTAHSTSHRASSVFGFPTSCPSLL